MGYKVAVVGATGNVGREMLDILAERAFPVSEVVALASSRSVGTEVSFGDRTLKCRALEHYDFSDTDICLMSAGGEVSKAWSPKIGQQGCVVIDNSSAWRMHPDVPLIVPEVNAAAAAGFTKMNIIANPNCSTAQLVVALKPLHEKYGVKRVVVSTYQSVSGAGKEGMDELFNQTRAVFSAGSRPTRSFMTLASCQHLATFSASTFWRDWWKCMRVFSACIRFPPVPRAEFAMVSPLRCRHDAPIHWVNIAQPMVNDRLKGAAFGDVVNHAFTMFPESASAML